uniref:Fe2OG dioxygenase domain-containing protein n=1 Tax=uncultured marine thaumarchaeote KM3_89_C12 TaxID=1456339 RepID=A0A075HXM2_9ARCH|nr:hypothetical protein [uncultured marine thaumarchaeote KM3_89_C12]
MSTRKFFTDEFPSPEQIKTDVQNSAFKVYHNAIQTDVYDEVRSFWLDYFLKDQPQREVARGDLLLGEENFNSYTDTDFWSLYRHFDFLWNEPTHQLTTDIAIELHRIRNIALNLPTEYGLNYNPECYGFYVSTSYYPPNGGMMTPHADGYPKNKKEFMLLHFMLPITFKGQDYEGGGMVVYDKNDQKVDVDKIMKPGSIIFYDGASKHGCERIIPYEDKKIGRLAMFAVPVYFLKEKPLEEKKGRFSKMFSK